MERLADAAVRDSSQTALYCAGCGTRSGSALLGKVFGNDIGDIVLHCRRFLWETANKAQMRGDSLLRVFLFGFSRGAFAARLLADFVSREGLSASPRRCAPLWRAYVRAVDFKSDPPSRPCANPPRIAYMGLWDTVDSTPTIRSWHLARLPRTVSRVRHAVAIHEYRRLFDYIPFDADSRVEEFFFPGSHSDIGGGYSDNREIADLTLRWIADGAREAGLRLREGAIEERGFDPSRATIHDSFSEASNAFGALDGIRRKIDPARLHPSAAAMGGGSLQPGGPGNPGLGKQAKGEMK